MFGLGKELIEKHPKDIKLKKPFKSISKAEVIWTLQMIKFQNEQTQKIILKQQD